MNIQQTLREENYEYKYKILNLFQILSGSVTEIALNTQIGKYNEEDIKIIFKDE